MATGGRLSIHLSTSGQTTKAEGLVRTIRISRENQRSPLSYFQNPGHVVLNFMWSLWVKDFLFELFWSDKQDYLERREVYLSHKHFSAEPLKRMS